MMNVRGATPSLLQTISSVTTAWMHWNGLRKTQRRTYTLWVIRNSGPWPTWVNKGLAKQWPPIILQPAPSSTQTHRAPTPHAETKSELLSDRQQQGHMEGCHTESGITVTLSTHSLTSHSHITYRNTMSLPLTSPVKNSTYTRIRPRASSSYKRTW